jgi:hypothetical protein
LFGYSVDLDKRVQQNHPLHKAAEKINFIFGREEVKETYRTNGNGSVDPGVTMIPVFSHDRKWVYLFSQLTYDKRNSGE